jgi:hypothetical protein
MCVGGGFSTLHFKTNKRMEVKIKDRKAEIEYFRMALSMCEIGVSYEQAELILKVNEELTKKKGEFKISDATDILYSWKEYWGNYFLQMAKDIKMKINKRNFYD